MFQPVEFPFSTPYEIRQANYGSILNYLFFSRFQDSLTDLNQQLQQHPSILPVDLFVTQSGELSLNVAPPDEIYDSHYDPKYMPSQEFEDQRVPVAKLSNSSSTDTSASPQVILIFYSRRGDDLRNY